MARSALLLRQARLHRKLAFRPRLRARPRRAYRPHAARPRRGHRALNTTVWIECGREPISTDAAPTTTAYCPPRGVGFMTTTATLPSALTKAVVSSMLRLGDARIRLAPGRMNFEKWPR